MMPKLTKVAVATPPGIEATKVGFPNAPARISNAMDATQ